MTTDLTPEVLAEAEAYLNSRGWFRDDVSVGYAAVVTHLANYAAEREAATRKRVEEMRGEMLNEFAETVAHEKKCAWLGWSAVPPDTSLRRLAERIINRWAALSTSTEQEKG